MLVNGKPEELRKYSKGTYSKEKFVQSIKDRWELTDLQIREAYLISDLAVKADGVFSVSYGKFIKMFEERFEMEISLSSVRRFFGLLSKLGVLTINEAKRKNNKKSANIYIVEPLEEAQEHVKEYSIEQTPEHIEEHKHEHTTEQINEHHNITKNKAFKNTLNKTINIPLTTSNREFIDNQLKDKYPHVPFEEVKQQIMNDDSLKIEHINQYKGMLEYRLKTWKPNQKKAKRTELLPDWYEKPEDYYKQPRQAEKSPEELERQKATIQAMLEQI